MKKVFSILIAALLIVSCISVFAENDVTVVVDGQTLGFDQPPVIENGRTLVPMRAIFEALGCDVDYLESENGDKFVYANKGGSYISLEIGSSAMNVNEETVTLDVPAKILNSRTLVPLRAVSEVLGASVLWNGNTRTVTIESKRGLHRYTTQTLTENRTGAYNLDATAKYPVIYAETEDSVIDAINAELKKDAEDFIKEAADTYAGLDLPEEDMPEYMRSLTYNMDYDITLDRNNLLSVVTYYYEYTGGVHGNSFRQGRTYDLTTGKQLSLSEIINTDAVSLETIIEEGLSAYLSDYDADDSGYVQSVINAGKAEISNAGYYLKDEGLVIFYVPYQIAAYATGYPTIEVPFSPEAFNVDLSGYNLPELYIELDGNITTGYEWMQASENDKLTVAREYIEPDTNLLGAPGVFKFNIKGAQPGYTELKLRYRRPWETTALKTVIYKLFVENGLGVTICGAEIQQ